MKSGRITIGFLLVAGCAASSPAVDNPQLTRLKKQLDTISMREQQCIAEARAGQADTLAQIAADDPSAELKARTALSNFSHAIKQCHAEAARANQTLSEQQSEEYRLEQSQARDRAALMATLAASPLH